MLHSFRQLTIAIAIGLGIALSGSTAHAQSVMKQCGEQWQAAKANGTTNGETWPQFLKECRARLASTTRGGFAPATPVPAPMPAPAQATTQAPVEPPYSSLPREMSSGEFGSDAQARAHCPSDTVVWVNTRSRVYHFAGTHNYGHTKEGAFMCEADARAAGDRAAMNEHHP
jgi:hypothetical protein